MNGDYGVVLMGVYTVGTCTDGVVLLYDIGSNSKKFEVNGG